MSSLFRKKKKRMQLRKQLSGHQPKRISSYSKLPIPMLVKSGSLNTSMESEKPKKVSRRHRTSSVFGLSFSKKKGSELPFTADDIEDPVEKPEPVMIEDIPGAESVLAKELCKKSSRNIFTFEGNHQLAINHRRRSINDSYGDLEAESDEGSLEDMDLEGENNDLGKDDIENSEEEQLPEKKSITQSDFKDKINNKGKSMKRVDSSNVVLFDVLDI